MFARLSESRSVLQGLIPELILSPNCHTVYIHMSLICNSCWVWSSWSVVAHFTHDVVNNTRNFHLRDRDNPHGTFESTWRGVIGDQLVGPYIFPQYLTGDIYANFLQDELPAFLENFLYKHNRCTTTMTEHSLISVRLSGSICIINSQTDGLVMAVHTVGHHVHQMWPH